jgi:hypothetical protein
MRANLLMATICGAAALAMNSVYGGSMAGILSWVGFHVAGVMGHLFWQQFSFFIAAIHACNGFGTIAMMMILLGVSRR